MTNLIGRTIGQYRIVEQIGLGGMATVYKAYQPSIDRYVAIKILPSELAKDPNFVKRFQHEAKAIAALEHPHILPVHDFGTDEGYTYMVMRYIEGGTLADLMGQPISNERIAQIVGNVAKALDYAHQEGVVHRDIKPSNVLIDQHGEVLLTDFGIAKMVEGAGDTQLTSAGSILGTPAYMAPEQAEGKAVNGRTDIYSLGVVLYELLTGQAPYQAETPLAIVLKHLNEPLPPPRTINAQVPEPFERIVLKAMAKDPDQRFQTAAEMDKALRQALKEIEQSPKTTPVPAPFTQTGGSPQTVPEMPAKSRSNLMPLFVVGGTVVLLLCLVGVGITGWALVSSSEEVTPTASGLLQATLPITDDASPTPTPEPAAATATHTPVSQVEDSNLATPVALPGLDGEIVFEEQFDSNRQGWFVGEETDEYGYSEAEITDGRYRLSQEADQSVVWWSTLDEAEFDDFVLTLEATPVEQSGSFAYGLVFRNDSDERFYSFEIDSDGDFFVNLFEDDDWVSLVDYTEMPAIKENGPNQLMVEAVGPMMRFFINGEEAATIEDDTVQSGTIGVVLEIYDAGDSATVDFDNLIVVQKPGPEEAQVETGGNILFEDYFDSDANGWATGEFEDEYTLDEITIEDGQYILRVTAQESAYVEKKLPNREFSDFVLTVDARPHDTEEHYSYGVAFRLNSDGHGYTFEIGNDGLYAVLLYDDEWKRLKDWSSSEAIIIGETNQIKIVAEDSGLTFFVNDQQLTTLNDDTVTSGQIGLVVDMFEDDTEATVSFDNLVIRSLENGD